MKNKVKRIPLLFSFLIMLFLSAGSISKAATIPLETDYSGAWDFYFYNTEGKVDAAKTIVIADDGSISVKAVMYIDNVVYQTRISAKVLPSGKISEGELIYLSNLEMVGQLTGSFTDTEGSGEWKNYQGKSVTWKAKRSDKKVKD